MGHAQKTGGVGLPDLGMAIPMPGTYASVLRVDGVARLLAGVFIRHAIFIHICLYHSPGVKVSAHTAPSADTLLVPREDEHRVGRNVAHGPNIPAPALVASI